MTGLFDGIRERYHIGRYLKVRAAIGKRRESLLDIGCGKPCDSMQDGSFIRFMGYGTGADTKECSSGFEFRRCSILDLPFPEKSFDAVVAMEVLEHIDDIDLALKNITRVLKDDGTFIMTTPNNGPLWKTVWYFWERTVGRMWEGTHETNLSEKEWKAVLGRYFTIESSQTHWGVDLIVKMRQKNQNTPNTN